MSAGQWNASAVPAVKERRREECGVDDFHRFSSCIELSGCAAECRDVRVARAA
jgi:hypothetical protein